LSHGILERNHIEMHLNLDNKERVQREEKGEREVTEEGKGGRGFRRP
jgi:hypothetical protein